MDNYRRHQLIAAALYSIPFLIVLGLLLRAAWAMDHHN